MSFVYTSADFKTDEILKMCSARGLGGGFPEKLLAADFTNAVKTAVQSRVSGFATKDLGSTPQVNNDLDLRRVLAIVNSIRNQDISYTQDVHERPEDSGYADSMRKFRNCTKFTNPTPKCRAISALIRTAETGTAGGGNQSQEDRKIILERDAFLGDFDKADAPNFLQQYTKGKIPLSELCMRLHTLSASFEEFRQDLFNYARVNDGKELSAELTLALNEMIGQFRLGVFLAQQQIFPLLRKETLQVRLVKIEEIAKLLAEHEADLPEAKQELRQLANILTCQNLYPVGAAFDRIKNNTLPPLRSDAAAWSRN
jgi:hypothetical protein